MKNFVFYSLGLILLVFSAEAYAFDVYGDRNDPYYVKVEKLEADHIRFLKCLKSPNRGTDDSNCGIIGNDNGYSLTQLRKAQNELGKRNPRMRLAITVGVAVAGAVLGGGVGGFFGLIVGTLEGSSAVISTYLATGVIAGGFIGGTVAHNVQNPKEKRAQAKALRDEVITDQDVLVPSVDDFVNDLREALTYVK